MLEVRHLGFIFCLSTSPFLIPHSQYINIICTITFGVCMDDIDKLRLRIQLAKRWMFESSELSIFSLTHFPTIIGTHTFSLSHFPDTVIGTHTFSLSHFPENIVHAHILTFLLPDSNCHAHILTFPLSRQHCPRTCILISQNNRRDARAPILISQNNRRDARAPLLISQNNRTDARTHILTQQQYHSHNDVSRDTTHPQRNRAIAKALELAHRPDYLETSGRKTAGLIPGYLGGTQYPHFPKFPGKFLDAMGEL